MSRASVQGELPLESSGLESDAAGRVDPGTWVVHPDWGDLWQAFQASPAGEALLAFIRQRSADGATIYPSAPLRALALAAPDAVRVVILGQDPYHGAGQAEGLAFSVASGVRPPPSLRNILKEVERDTGQPPAVRDSLVPWTEQGVLLLNTCLTVEDGSPASHAGRGWEILTDRVIRRCSELGPPKVFLLWGAHAQKKVDLIDGSRHRVLCANHPSPLSANRGPVPFMGCSHFTRTNQWLIEQGLSAIRW